jgi:hypothetical protein
VNRLTRGINFAHTVGHELGGKNNAGRAWIGDFPALIGHILLNVAKSPVVVKK